MSRYCASCRAPLGDVAGYVRLCKLCFAAAKKAERDDMLAELAALRDEVSRLRVGHSLSIDPPMVRRLLQLCHPDRHTGSALAHEVTAWLLSQRREAAHA